MMRTSTAALAFCLLLVLSSRSALGSPPAPVAQAIATERIAPAGVSFAVLDVE